MDSVPQDIPSMFDAIRDFFVAATPSMPPQAAWVAAVILFVLAAAAIVDIVTGTIPDFLIFFGMAGIVGLQGVYVSFPFAAHQMIWGLLGLALVWGVNELWLRAFKHDALGMGDGKWTMLAVTCFGGIPVLVAWGFGAVLGSIFLIGLMIVRRKLARVHFAPFLFVGLIVGIWAARLGGVPYLTELSTRLSGGI
jgi:prepilin signal peptidase PulO-like enzyme (type II secretory pathway)